MFGSGGLSAPCASAERIIRAVCLLVMATIRGIPNPVSSLSPIEVTTRGLARRVAAVAANFEMPSVPQSVAPRANITTLADSASDDYQEDERGLLRP